jgi:gliding motility-associated-like protein
LGSELLLEVILDKAITDWEWEDGNKNPKRIINNEGNYIVTALIDGCSFESSIQIIADDCKGAIYVPNIFSPNGDNTNDVFFPDFAEVEILSLKIFNRWGVLVFDSINEPWDGRWNATEAPVGSYAYTITYKDLASDRENSLMGWVTLVR